MPTPRSPLPAPRSGENAVVWTIWLTYGAFYFCRQNLSAALTGMESPIAEGGLAITGEQAGWILASLKIAYGLGQLVNGQLSERVSPRVMLAIGMFGSAALNVLFGFSSGFHFLLVVWAMNGVCQSLGWTPCIRVVANWVPVERRGKTIGIIGTGYQVTLGLTYLIAGQATRYLGWRGALYVPAVLLALAGLFMLVFLREAPEEEEAGSRERGAGSKADESSGDASDPQPPAPSPQPLSATDCLYFTLFNPALWLLGLTLSLLNAVRYGYFDWGLTHLMQTRDMPVDKAVLQYFVIAIGAAAGAYLVGWATDRFFGSRRAPLICILLVVLGLLSLVYESAVQSSAIATMLLLVAIGFCIIGPQVLVVGTAPADLAHRGASAAAAGFVNFMGYIGAATGDVITGYFSSSAHGGWHLVLHIWAGWAFAGAAIMAILWNATAGRVGLLPSVVPKLAALALLTAAGTAVTDGGQSGIVRWATYAGAVCAAATFANRLAAIPAMVVATFGLIVVFVTYVISTEAVTWQQTVAMVSYGLAMIATLMILVDREDRACE